MVRRLCRDAKAALEVPVMTTDACDVWKSCLRELRKTEVGLKLLGEEMELFTDIDHFNEEFTTNVKYEDEIILVMIQLYYVLKIQKCDTIER